MVLHYLVTSTSLCSLCFRRHLAIYEANVSLLHCLGDTRPINCSNGFHKILEGRIGFGFSEATRLTHNSQRSIRGRVMLDNVMDIHSKALCFAMQGASLSGIVSCDVEGAFTSLDNGFRWCVKADEGS